MCLSGCKCVVLAIHVQDCSGFSVIIFIFINFFYLYIVGSVYSCTSPESTEICLNVQSRKLDDPLSHGKTLIT